jgi:hypothetical protein
VPGIVSGIADSETKPRVIARRGRPGPALSGVVDDREPVAYPGDVKEPGDSAGTPRSRADNQFAASAP